VQEAGCEQTEGADAVFLLKNGRPENQERGFLRRRPVVPQEKTVSSAGKVTE